MNTGMKMLEQWATGTRRNDNQRAAGLAKATLATPPDIARRENRPVAIAGASWPGGSTPPPGSDQVPSAECQVPNVKSDGLLF
jgi:hypothetical protein